MKQKAVKALTVSMIAITGIWVIAMLVLCLLLMDDAWGTLGMIVMLPYSGILLIGILSVIGSVRRLIIGKQNGGDPVLSVFTTVTAAVFALLTTASMVLPPIIDEIAPQNFDAPYMSGVFSRMFMAFGFLCAVTALSSLVFDKLIRKFRSEEKPGLQKRLRTAAISFVAVVALVVLFVPYPAGSYNDGGSEIYEAVFYDIVDWNRSQEFDGTPFFEENQRMRIYFFPQNCYSYETKWNIGH